MTTRKENCGGGFTLVEIVVTLCVIGVLMAIVLPIFFSAKRRAADTACLSNLQQTSLALSLYLSDYDGHYPTAISAVFENGHAKSDKTWRDFLVPYLKTPQFPECPYDDPSVSMMANARRIDLCGYAYNARFSSAVRARNSAEYIGRNEALLTYPSITVCLFEARPGILTLRSPDTTGLNPVGGILRSDLLDDIRRLSPEPIGITAASTI